MHIAIAGGHSKAAPGASGYLDEYSCDRAYVSHLVDALRAAGYAVTDCTNEKTTANAEMAEEVRLANASGADVFLAVHFNAGGGTGTEVWYYTGDAAGRDLAARMSANVASSLGLRDRGAKATTALYVVRNTNMTAVLLETCFVDTASDADAWHAAPWDAVCQAVVDAFGGVQSSAPAAPAPAPAPEASSGFDGGAYRCTVNCLNVRSAPSTSGAVVASYSTGQTVNLDSWYTVADGYVWGRYTAYSGATRYIAVGRATGKPEPDDYLVKC